MTKTADNTLYVPIVDVKEKRRSLLLSIKDTLILQEEYEKLLSVRAEKKAVLKEIKKKIDNVNNNYQKIKKTLPNIKNILGTTEKQILQMEEKINSLKASGRNQKLLKELEKELAHKKKETTSKSDQTKQETKKEEQQPIKKIDRVKNNLKIIEAKLGKL